MVSGRKGVKSMGLIHEIEEKKQIEKLSVVQHLITHT